MKKRSLLLLGVGMLALYSCNSGNNAASEQAKQDSIANAAKVQEAAAAQAKQDSIVNAANMETMKAQAQADSLKGAMAQKDAQGTKTVIIHEKTHHHTGAKETEPTPAQPANPTSSSKWNQNTNTNTTNQNTQTPTSKSKWGK